MIEAVKRSFTNQRACIFRIARVKPRKQRPFICLKFRDLSISLKIKEWSAFQSRVEPCPELNLIGYFYSWTVSRQPHVTRLIRYKIKPSIIGPVAFSCACACFYFSPHCFRVMFPALLSYSYFCFSFFTSFEFYLRIFRRLRCFSMKLTKTKREALITRRFWLWYG